MADALISKVRALFQGGLMANQAIIQPWSSAVTAGITSSGGYFLPPPSGEIISASTNSENAAVVTYEVAYRASPVFDPMTVLARVSGLELVATQAGVIGVYRASGATPVWSFNVPEIGDVFIALTVTKTATHDTLTARVAPGTGAVAVYTSPPIAGPISSLYGGLTLTGSTVLADPVVTVVRNVTQVGIPANASQNGSTVFTIPNPTVFTPAGNMTVTASKGATTATFTLTNLAARWAYDILQELAVGVSQLTGATLTSFAGGNGWTPRLGYAPQYPGDPGWTFVFNANCPTISQQIQVPVYSTPAGQVEILEYIITGPVTSRLTVGGGADFAISPAGMAAMVAHIEANRSSYKSAAALAQISADTFIVTATGQLTGSNPLSFTAFLPVAPTAYDRLYAARVTVADRYATEMFAYPTLPWDAVTIPGGVATGNAVWDNAANANDAVYSSGRHLVHGTYLDGWTVTEWAATSGVWYFEAHISQHEAVGFTSNVGPGIGSTGVTGAGHCVIYTDLATVSVYENGVLDHGPVSSDTNNPASPANGTPNTIPVVGCMVDADTRQATFYFRQGGIVQTVGPFSVPGSGPIYAVGGGGASTQTFAWLNGGQDSFVYGLPQVASPLTGGGPSADLAFIGYTDADEVTCAGVFNTQATMPTAYFSASVALAGSQGSGDAYVIDNQSENFSGTRTLAATTCAGSFVYGTPQNFSSTVTLGTTTSAATFFADTEKVWTGGGTLADVASTGIMMPLASADFSGDVTLGDALNDGGYTLATPVVSIGTAALTAPIPVIAAAGTVMTVGRAALTAPAPTLVAAGVVSGTSRAILAAPRPTLVASGFVAFSGNAALTSPVPTLSARGGHSARLTAPMASLSITGKVGAVARAVLTAPAATLVASGSQANVGRATLTAPMARMTTLARGNMVAPSSYVTAYGSVTEAVSLLAYSFNIKKVPAGSQMVTATTDAVRYPGYQALHVCRMNSKNYAITSTGVHEVTGQTDNGAVIPWTWRTIYSDFESTSKKTLVSAFIGGVTPTNMRVTVDAADYADDAYSQTVVAPALLRNHRQKFGLGRKARYYAIGMSDPTGGNVNIENVELELAGLTRRI